MKHFFISLLGFRFSLREYDLKYKEEDDHRHSACDKCHKDVINSRNYIGRTQWWDSSVANDNADYCGTMDDFRLYNIALTEEEIQALMTPTSLGETAATPATRTFLANTLLSGSEEIQVRSPWDSAEQTLYIFNAQGALLAAHRLPGATASIDAPAAPGTYLLTLQEKTSGKELSQKIIIR